MAYIALEYYKTDYVGNDPGDNTELNRYIARASDIIDILTDDNISSIESLTVFQQKCVKKATAAFTEYFVENGDVFSEQASGSESIGSWSQSGASGEKSKMLSKVGLSWLYKSGLVDDSVRVGGHEYWETEE